MCMYLLAASAFCSRAASASNGATNRTGPSYLIVTVMVASQFLVRVLSHDYRDQHHYRCHDPNNDRNDRTQP